MNHTQNSLLPTASNAIPVITIDGPGGSGKGTLGQLLAKELHWHYLDSGALYRLLALAAEKHRIDLENIPALTTLAAELAVEFDTTHPIGAPAHISLEGKEVSELIRQETYGNAASKIAVLPEVRQALLSRQRNFRQPPGLVTDGRDMGSIVFPDATLKIFLVASAEERAHRRYLQLKAQGINVSLDALCDELKARDRRDEERVVAPLKPASGAILIDTTGLTIDAVLQRVRKEVQRVFGIT